MGEVLGAPRRALGATRHMGLRGFSTEGTTRNAPAKRRGPHQPQRRATRMPLGASLRPITESAQVNIRSSPIFPQTTRHHVPALCCEPRERPIDIRKPTVRLRQEACVTVPAMDILVSHTAALAAYRAGTDTSPADPRLPDKAPGAAEVLARVASEPLSAEVGPSAARAPRWRASSPRASLGRGRRAATAFPSSR